MWFGSVELNLEVFRTRRDAKSALGCRPSAAALAAEAPLQRCRRSSENECRRVVMCL